MDNYCIDEFNLKDGEGSAEYNFAIDLIRYVLETRMTGLNWKPEGIFLQNDQEENTERLFNSQMAAAVKAKLDRYENKYHKEFDSHFPDKIVQRKIYISMCRGLRHEFLRTEFSAKEFMRFSVVVAKYAGLAYLFGIMDAPKIAVKIICGAVRHMLKMGTVDEEEFWNEMQEWLKDPDLEETEETYSDDSERTETSSESGRQPL